MDKLQIALAGNPNSGKTTVYNALTGANQYVGNWPGVTVERKSGAAKQDKNLGIHDLPGIYSLSPYTPEEIVARDYILGQHAQAIMNIVDATNLERNLYLTTQLMETGLPIVVALNMMDAVKKQGRQINLEHLAYGLGVTVVGMSALRGTGVNEALTKTVKIAHKHDEEMHYPIYDRRLEVALADISDLLGEQIAAHQKRWYAIKVFERDEAVLTTVAFTTAQRAEFEEITAITEKIFSEDAESIIVNERYNFIEKIIQLAVNDGDGIQFTLSDKIDRIVTNRILALPIFIVAMWLVYYISIQTVGTIGTDWVNDTLFGTVIPDTAQHYLHVWGVAPWLQSLILDGVIAGCGAVLGFVPQIFVLFICLGILEDTGYMSRIAFVMDRLFRRFGMSGKSFIPMLIATGCGVPGVMASRTIENVKDRRITIMVTTFMPCSAKLPIIALIAGAFFPANSWVAPSAYFIGIGAIILSGIALKKTRMLAGDVAPFIMELPSYHLPKWSNVLRYAFSRAMSFIKRAGTIIFVLNILIWFLSSYNFMLQTVAADKSILADFGKLLAPIFAPLGWGHWKAAVATLTGLVAKETVVGTFGVLYHNSGEVSNNGREIWGHLATDFSALSAYSFLVFNLLCAPCFAAIGAIHREMGALKWTLIAIGYQCGLAYCVSLLIYQFGRLVLEHHVPNLETLLAVLIAGGLVYAIVKRPIKVNQPELTTLN
ncbi:MAG: ferrous iron transport protein B [Lactobacillaceae bacterium]|jgi:ferrous iron transport protein B|nr:ferrous iron transport protein B [Lactobacillaceae bacterium]